MNLVRLLQQNGLYRLKLIYFLLKSLQLMDQGVRYDYVHLAHSSQQ